MESWLQGTAITHQRPGQPVSLCALRIPPVPGHGPLALDCPPPASHPPQEWGWSGGGAGLCVGKGLQQTRWGEGVTRAGFLEEGKREENGCELRGLNGEGLETRG